MKVKFLGAAGTVTGSCHCIETAAARFAIDCGMHQGNETIERRNLDTSIYDPRHMDFFILTHAHIDHTGLLPRMVKTGFSGKIYCTPPTRDLLGIMLEDSAHIQEMEAEWASRKSRRHGGRVVEALYTQADAQAATDLLVPVPYGQPFSPAPGITAIYHDAGHILGSAFIELTLEEDGKRTRMLFSGDLGRPDQLLVSDPDKPVDTDYLFLEGTYGDRDHKNVDDSREELAEAIRISYERGGKVIIPAFAVERTQEILFCLHKLLKEGRIPSDMPVYVDSPLAIKATEIFKRNPSYLDEETRAYIDRGEDPLSLPNLRFTLSTDQSREINDRSGPAIVIAASGMCNAGRIKHHLRHNLWRPEASIVFVGFQAMGTPGRKIVDGAKKIRILGEEVAVNARIFTIGGFSSHAGQSQILTWLSHFKVNHPQVFLVHGEQKALDTLAGLVRQQFGLKVRIPQYLEEYTLTPGVEPTVAVDEEKARPHIDWAVLFTEMEGRLSRMREHTTALAGRPVEEQAEMRQRLLALDRELLELLSEM
ncbi:MBL fold metallo-hydrolase RNA specificity domain-containing protein [Desulfovibrio sp. TomC]|uniref:MBL fold metallo-hydrolase RNA specificity domain-containing protein n=1 Tax=Desulfovibrio sp. TomC TaxID=1562888 RepID=UPI000574C363|nr:MBL fold metallo-hydrolase [Desulfovibrio sp. TomC]KHK04055.1 Metallo-beta-lactamase family protein, RNA-specific [Desulfovibrio sp. TomC]